MISNKLIFVPHVGLEGGAGIYIKGMAAELGNKFTIEYMGQYARDFGAGTSDSFPSYLRKMVFPNYVGVKCTTKLIYLLFSITSLLLLYPFTKSNSSLRSIFVLTSGIQVFQFLYLRKKYPNSVYILLVQENIQLNNNFYGAVTKKILNRINLVVSITNTWKEYAEEHGVSTLVWKNRFVHKTNSDNCLECFDILYVGGDQRIKGFETLIEFYRVYSKDTKLTICILGEVSEKKLNIIDSLNEKSSNGSRIVSCGFVENVDSYIQASKILLLPLIEPHFCRPAIEAGLHGKSFIVRRLDSISDFAIDELNCLMFSEMDDLLVKVKELLTNKELRRKLECENYSFAQKFTVDSGDDLLIIDFIAKHIE